MSNLLKTNRVDSLLISALVLAWLVCTIIVEIYLLSTTSPTTNPGFAMAFLGLAALGILYLVIRATFQRLSLTHRELAAARIKTIEASGTLDIIMDSIEFGMAIIDQTGRIQLVNQAFATISGRDKATLYDLKLLDVLSSMGIRTEDGLILDVQSLPLTEILEGRHFPTQVISFTSLDGSNYFSLTINPVVSAATGACLGALFSIRDITEQKNLEHLKDEFIGLVSHELKTPLTVIRGFAQLLKLCFTKRKGAIREAGLTQFSEEILVPGVEENCIDKTLSEIDRMAGMIDEMVQITRIDSGKLYLNITPCDLASVTQEILARFQLNGNNNRFEYDPQPGLQGTVDPNAYSQIVSNFVSNAVKYSPPDSPILVKLYRQDKWVCISVTDHGIGIPLAEQKSIFSKFYRTFGASNMDAEGLGLGLYITARLVELHGGSIKLTSEPGSGSTFEARFPAVS